MLDYYLEMFLFASNKEEDITSQIIKNSGNFRPERIEAIAERYGLGDLIVYARPYYFFNKKLK